MSGPTTTAGWYPAPHANNQLRYWDGYRWQDTVPGQQPGRQKGLAILALCLGLVAAVLCWIPWLGVLLTVAAVIVGIVALVKKQSVALTLIGLIPAAIGLIFALVITVGFTAILATSPAVPGEPDSAQPAGPDLSTFETVDDREMALIHKNPDGSAGKELIIYGDIIQLDAATGPCNFLMSAAADPGLDFGGQFNAFAASGDGSSVCPVFDPLVEGDRVKLWVTVLGSLSYDTQVGGNTTVPEFHVWQAEAVSG